MGAGFGNNAYEIAGSDFVSAGANSNASTDASRPSFICYKCEQPGHGVKDCKTSLFCVNCTK